mmetsp:Transcript_35796/g.114004  ORF Transcript_35796/g.114004 Transcript_35796/m.114004 type:complete len:222 (-) Transcript_35796:3070-3735(-)
MELRPKAAADASCSSRSSTCAPDRSSRSIWDARSLAARSPSRALRPKPVAVIAFSAYPEPEVRMTACSSPSLVLAVASMCISYVSLVHSRKTCTGLVCPIRWQRAIACRSFCGFQSGSNMTMVSAAVRLMPTPPARVVMMKMNDSEAGSEKRSMAACRSRPVTAPSSLSYPQPRPCTRSSIRSSILVNWEKSRTRWPSALSLGSSLSSRTSLPDDWTSRSR